MNSPLFYRQHSLELVIKSEYIFYPYSLWVPVTIHVLDTNSNAILFKYKSFKTLFIRYESLKKKLNVVSVKEKRKRARVRTKNAILWIMYFLMIIQLFNRKLPKGPWHGLFTSLSSRVWIYSVKFQSHQGRLKAFSCFSQQTKLSVPELISHVTLDSCHWEKAISICSHHDLQLSLQGERQSGKLLL